MSDKILLLIIFKFGSRKQLSVLYFYCSRAYLTYILYLSSSLFDFEKVKRPHPKILSLSYESGTQNKITSINGH